MNDLLLKALRSEPVSRPPIWLMRQAGRYLPSYQALRTKYSLKEMFHQPDLVHEVTRLPLTQLGVDAAILFSDILVIAESLGLSVHFPDQGGPYVEPPLRTTKQVNALSYIPVEESLSYVYHSIAQIKKSITVPLIGFSGGPFTVASYFIDSKSINAFEQTKGWMKEDANTFHALLLKITQATIAHLKAQVKAGADVLQVFDSWSNVLNDEEFVLFSIPYLKQIVEAFKGSNVPVILFCRDSSLRVEALAAIEPSAISFDWHVPMIELRQRTPRTIAVQGNFHPHFLKQSKKQIAEEVRELLFSMQGEKGFIVNLGHGIPPDIPVENVRYFVEEVIQFDTKNE